MNLSFTKSVLVAVLCLLGISGAFAQLSGSYTIDASSSASNNYTSVTAAASALATSGVNGAVTFTISDGTYTGQVSFNSAISGASSTNTITFKSKSADAQKVKITNTGTYTVYMSAADYITFEDVTLESTNTGTRYVLYMTGGADHNNFLDCIIKGPQNSSTSYSVYALRSEFNTWKGCRINGNYYGFRIYGTSDADGDENNVIEDCDVSGHYYYGIYMYYQDGITIKNCTIDSAQTGIGYGLYHYRSYGSLIDGNEMNTGYYPFYMAYSNYYNTSGDTIRVHNNSVGNAVYYGLYQFYTDKVNYYHNSFEANTGYYAVYMYNYQLDEVRVANNIFVSEGGYYGMYVYFGGTAYQPSYWDHNDYWFSNNTYFAYFNGSFANSLTALQGLFSRAYDQNSLEVDPDWIGFDRRTYTPSLNNAGVDKGVNVDIDGNVRPNVTDGKVDIGPNDYWLADYDLDVFALNSPLSVSLVSNQIQATFKNAGSKTISNTTVDVQYSIDSGATWVSDTMGVISLDPGKSKTFSFGTTWTPSRSGNFQVSIRINPQITNDPDTKDQKDWQVCSGLSGTFTVGKFGDFKTPQEAVDALRCGVAGPIVFDIAGGTYTGNLEFGVLNGASATNTVTFRSPSTDSVTITHSGPENTIELDGADYVSFENVKVLATGTSGFTVHLMNAADYNNFTGCVIQANPTAISTTSNPVVFSSSRSAQRGYGNNGNYNVFRDNEIIGGYYGVTVQGSSTSDFSLGNEFHNNNITGAYYYGVYMYYVGGLIFQDNKTSNLRNIYAYGFYSYYMSNFSIERNYSKSGYGDFLPYTNFYQWNNTMSTYANNTVICDYQYSYGIYAYYMQRVNFYHNSISSGGNYCIYGYYAQNNDIRNNIFMYGGTNYLWYGYYNTFIDFDYNDYVITGSGNVAFMGGTVLSNLSALKGWNSDYNQNSFEEDPEWVDDASDLHVTSKFPKMYGANVGVELDGDQDQRCRFAPSIGADEFAQVVLPPTASFLAPDTAWLGSPAIMLNSNKANKLAGAMWYVNDTFASDSIHLQYIPTTTGMDTIMLVMENCSGTDTIEKLIFVSPILRAPKVDFAATSTDVYTNDVLRLLDLSTGGATEWTWDISPRRIYNPFFGIYDDAWNFDTTAANPGGTFFYPGVYQIKLKVANSFGADSVVRTAYIKVRQRSSLCDIPWDTDGEYGTLYDNGGVDGGYSAALNGLDKCTYLISSCRGEIEFDVDQFDLGEDDYLRIYDGDDDNGRPLWDAAAYPDGMTGNKTDRSVKLSFTSQTGSAYFVFESDNSAQTLGKGFAINWEYTPITWTNPTAAINSPDTACLGFPVTFENASTGNWSYVEWDLDMDGNIDGSGEFFSYTPTSAGVDSIFLKSYSLCAGPDSILKTIVIEDASKLATPDFSAASTIVSAGDTVTISGSADYCVSGFAWEITPANYLLANNTKLTDETIDVVFTKGGFFSVELEATNPKGTDSLLKTNYIQVLDYCTPSVVNLDADLGISRVVFGDIDNSSTVGKVAYSNYTHISTEVERGYSYQLTVERATNNKGMNRKVWIDWNIDGDFDDAGELVATEADATTLSFTEVIKIDPAAKAGNTRMRIATSYKKQGNLACGPHAFGEFEDYGITVLSGDRTAPTLTLTGAKADTIEVFDTWTEPGFTATDLVDGNLTSSVTVTNGLDNTVLGSYTVVYEVKDAEGNTSTDTRTIVVLDRTIPTHTLDGTDTAWVQIFTSYTDAGSTFDDNYDKSMTRDELNNVDTANLGTYNVTYCVTDGSGNGPICVNRTVIVFDTIAPVIALDGISPQVVDVFSNYVDAGVTASDNHTSTVTTSGTWDGTVDELGTFTLTYTVTDAAGNSASVTRTIEVVDRVAPTITLNGNLVETVERWSDYTDAGVTVADNYDAEVDVTVTPGGTFVNTQSVGIYTVTYSATDLSSNTSTTLQRLVIVEQPVGINVGPIADNEYTVFPNPSNGSLVVRTSLDNGVSTQLRVLDLTGKEILNVGNHVVSNGQFAVDLSNLATGTYHLEITSADARVIEQVVIAR